MAPVFELPLPEDDVGVVLPVGPVEELEPPINAPGPISGLSKKEGVKRPKKDGEESSYHRWTSL